MKINPKFSGQLQTHLKVAHNASPWTEYLQEIVYGANDGIVTTFAVVAGFAGAGGNEGLLGYSALTVVLFGVANLFADGSSMGLGNFLSLRSQIDLYKNHEKKELKEIRTNPNFEKEETIEILMTKGYSQKDARELTHLYMKNENHWLEFMMRDELQMENLQDTNPYIAGFITFLSFIVFGFIPLIPYFIFKINSYTFILSILFTFVALLLLGLLRWIITKDSILKSVGEVILVGGISASIAYLVGTFFK